MGMKWTINKFKIASLKCEFQSTFRSSTPKTEEIDATIVERKRMKEHFLQLISSTMATTQHSSHGGSLSAPLIAIFNQMNTENARKKAYANIYSGPISNRGGAPIHNWNCSVCLGFCLRWTWINEMTKNNILSPWKKKKKTSEYRKKQVNDLK